MWDERYSAEHYIYGKKPNAFLYQYADKLPKGRVLCLADGEGRNSVFLASLGYQVTAVDASAVGLEKAAQLAREENVAVEHVHADLADYDMGENCWDAIVSIFCHLPPELRKDVHHRVVRALKPGGMLLLEAYTPQQLDKGTGGPPSADMMMNKRLLVEELDGLQFEWLKERERDVVEGSHHTGVGAVVQVLAEKS